ncbi:MAG: hypothetical protein DK304_000473 [Chloroflexi bacterium]|jgi:hypothetical protein|nr:MAG: hypothetical protein DK304_000473 [Chloroflexota bacterium]
MRTSNHKFFLGCKTRTSTFLILAVDLHGLSPDVVPSQVMFL